MKTPTTRSAKPSKPEMTAMKARYKELSAKMRCTDDSAEWCRLQKKKIELEYAMAGEVAPNA